jgi:hypothetical protein
MTQKYYVTLTLMLVRIFMCATEEQLPRVTVKTMPMW